MWKRDDRRVNCSRRCWTTITTRLGWCTGTRRARCGATPTWRWWRTRRCPTGTAPPPWVDRLSLPPARARSLYVVPSARSLSPSPFFPPRRSTEPPTVSLAPSPPSLPDVPRFLPPTSRISSPISLALFPPTSLLFSLFQPVLLCFSLFVTVFQPVFRVSADLAQVRLPVLRTRNDAAHHGNRRFVDKRFRLPYST